MSGKLTKKEHSEALAAARPAMSPEQIARLQAAAALPDDTINLSDPDAPEVLDRSGAATTALEKCRKHYGLTPTFWHSSKLKAQAISPA